jgi:hypothetical protein
MSWQAKHNSRALLTYLANEQSNIHLSRAGSHRCTNTYYDGASTATRQNQGAVSSIDGWSMFTHRQSSRGIAGNRWQFRDSPSDNPRWNVAGSA